MTPRVTTACAHRALIGLDHSDWVRVCERRQYEYGNNGFEGKNHRLSRQQVFCAMAEAAEAASVQAEEAESAELQEAPVAEEGPEL